MGWDIAAYSGLRPLGNPRKSRLQYARVAFASVFGDARLLSEAEVTRRRLTQPRMFNE